jgi:glycosyltransferase involved in cell wall biosynthesis
MWKEIANSGIEIINNVKVYRLKPSSIKVGYATLMSDLKDLVKNINPDLVHSHGMHPHLFQLIAWQNEMKYKVVSQLHFPELTGAEGLAKLAYPLVKRYLRYKSSKISAFVANTIGEKQWLISEGVEEKRVHQITYPCLPSSLFSLEKHHSYEPKHREKTILLFVGRIVYKKGIHTLIQSLPKVVSNLGKDFVVIIAGPRNHAYYTKLLRLADKLGVSEYIVWKDAIVGQEKYDQILDCDFFISPSVSDLHPITLMEAQALGKPVVSTKVGLIPEIVKDKETGLLVSPENPMDLSGAIESLILNQTLRQTMGENARKWISQRFLLENSVNDLEKLYADCLG